MTPATGTLRVLRLAGLFLWLLIAVAALVEGMGRPRGFMLWGAGLLGFGALYCWGMSRQPSWPVLAAQVGCVLVMAGGQYRGFEGMLLVLVALELGLIAARTTGLVWIAAQSIALFIAICYRWSWYEAQLFTPPYFGFQVLAFVIVELIGREASGRTALARTNAELVSTRELLAEHVRLAERRWIGRELHDAMGHHLAGLSLHLEVLAQREAPSPPLDTARALTRRLLDDVESLVTTLERDRGVDLAGALGALATEIPSPRVHVEIDGLAQQAPARAHALLRCCQEIVTNAIKHAGADNLWIRVRERDGRVELIARDDGKRPPIARTGHGLDGMRQRLAELGGSLEVASPPGGGFELRALVPAGDR
jgi:signal transduction histidine kinase